MLLSFFHEDGTIFKDVVVIKRNLVSVGGGVVSSAYVDKYISGLYIDTWEYLDQISCFGDYGTIVIDRRKFRV